MKKSIISKLIGRQGAVMGTIFNGQTVEIVQKTAYNYRVKLIQPFDKYNTGFTFGISCDDLILKGPTKMRGMRSDR